MKHLAKIGTALLILALLLTWQVQTWIALGALVAVALIDLYLVWKEQQTISSWIHRLFPKKTDVIIMVGLLGYTWYIFSPVGFLPVMIGVIMGHLFWNE